jgi:glycerophosphoryl diester phosphodiesterase
MKAADGVMAAIPRRRPSVQSLRDCRVISHRGEHDNKTVLENTLPAFARARQAGVWGIECDIRWSADLVPLVCHDPDGMRVFGDPGKLRELAFPEIRQRMPLLPSLSELVAEFGGNTHLMLEIKAEDFPAPQRQQHILQDALAGLEPGRDYHFLALDPALFELVAFVPRNVCLPVAELNGSALSRLSLERGYGGITGHYLLLNNALKRAHEAAGQRIGTGFVDSRNCLFRELNRGVTWIFSNRAVQVQAVRDACLRPSG